MIYKLICFNVIVVWVQGAVVQNYAVMRQLQALCIKQKRSQGRFHVQGHNDSYRRLAI
jgi:hypothetical protein